jgi:hypothetical protein
MMPAFLPATTEADQFTDTEVGVYAENKIQWAEKFRSVAAIRGDLDYFDVRSMTTPANSGTSATMLPSPKLSLIAGPWEKTELYAQGGFGFHSNDGRGATQNVEPVSAANPYPNTYESQITPAAKAAFTAVSSAGRRDGDVLKSIFDATARVGQLSRGEKPIQGGAFAEGQLLNG